MLGVIHYYTVFASLSCLLMGPKELLKASLFTKLDQMKHV